MAACLAEAMGPDCPAADLPGLAVGCSGGPDSMALTCLLKDWAARHAVPMTALIVDHGLRHGSDAEAACVAGWLTERGVDAVVLAHTGDRPKSNIQAEARQLRYDLMRDWCIVRQVPVLAVAHHLEDQAETFLLRLARGSGVDGLAAMAPVTAVPGDPYRQVTLIRPLLDMPRADIHAVLARSDWPFVEDPSNRDIRHARVRMRNLASALAKEGLDPQRLARTARTMRRARQALETATRDFLSASAFLDPYGYAGMDRTAFARTEEEVGLRALTRLLQLVSGGDYPFRLDRLESLAAALRSETPTSTRTLAGCRVENRSGTVMVFREEAAIVPPEPARETCLWDRRFQVKLAGDLDGLTLGKLGAEGVRQARARGLADDRFEQAPGPARAALPGLWRGDVLIAVGGQDGGAASVAGDRVGAAFRKAVFAGIGASGDPFARRW